MQTFARHLRASYVTPLLCNRNLMPRIVTLAFNEAILLYLLSIFALVLVNTLSELDTSIGMPELRFGLSTIALVTRPALDHLFQVVMGPANAVASPPDGGGNTNTFGNTVRNSANTASFPTGPTAQRHSVSVSGEAGNKMLHTVLSSGTDSRAVLWTGTDTGMSLPEATAAVVPPCRGSTPGEPFHDIGRPSTGGSEINLTLPTNADYKSNAQARYPRKGPQYPPVGVIPLSGCSTGREREAEPQPVDTRSQGTRFPLGGWFVGISAGSVGNARTVVPWLVPGCLVIFARQTRSAITALCRTLLARLHSRVSSLDGLRLGFGFIIFDLCIASISVLATADVDLACTKALLFAVIEFITILSSITCSIDLALVSRSLAVYIYTICTHVPNSAVLDHTRAAHREMQGFRRPRTVKNSTHFPCATPGQQGVHHRSKCHSSGGNLGHPHCKFGGHRSRNELYLGCQRSPPYLHTPMVARKPAQTGLDLKSGNSWRFPSLGRLRPLCRLPALLGTRLRAVLTMVVPPKAPEAPGGCMGHMSVEPQVEVEVEPQVEVEVEVEVDSSSPQFGQFNAHKTPFLGAFAFPAISEGGGDVSKVRLPQFSGKEAEYQGWKTQALAYFRKKGLINALTRNSAPPVYTKIQSREALIQMDAARRATQRKYTYDANGQLDENASKTVIDADVKAWVKQHNQAHADWVFDQETVYDDLALAAAINSKPMRLITSIKSKYGADAWSKLTSFYDQKLKGDVRALKKRLSDGETTKGQRGMVDGDNVKTYIQDLDALHTQLYFSLEEDERDACPELTDDNMKQVLLDSLNRSYIDLALTYDASMAGNATYEQICNHLRTMENM